MGVRVSHSLVSARPWAVMSKRILQHPTGTREKGGRASVSEVRQQGWGRAMDSAGNISTLWGAYDALAPVVSIPARRGEQRPKSDWCEWVEGCGWGGMGPDAVPDRLKERT